MAPPNDYVGSKNGLVIETKYICRLLPDDKIFRLLVTRGGAEWRAAPPRHPRGEEYHSWAGHRYYGPSHCWAGHCYCMHKRDQRHPIMCRTATKLEILHPRLEIKHLDFTI